MSRVLQLEIASLVALMGMLVVNSADAQSVTKNGTTVFDAGGFELDTVGAQPGAPPIGSWLQIEPGNPVNMGVYGPASGGPGAALGNNYLHAFRPNDPSNAYLRAGFSQSVATGDHLHLSTWVYLDQVPPLTNALFLGFESADLSTRLWLATTDIPSAAPGTYRPQVLQGGAGSDLIDIPYTPRQWQEWTIDWIVGSSEATFGIAGATQTRMVSAGPLSTPITEVRFASSNFPTTFYLDGRAVPEPSSFVLMGLGLIGAGAWRLRQRVK